MNLINNALKFTKKGGKINLNVKEYREHNLIYISVKDNGVGMTPETMKKIGKKNQKVIYILTNNVNHLILIQIPKIIKIIGIGLIYP